MERFDLDKVRGISNKLFEPFLKFGRSRARKSEHQQLLVLDIFKIKQRCQLVYEQHRFSASRASCHDDEL